MKTKTERRLNKFAEQAQAEVALLGLVGMGKAPGKPVEGMTDGMRNRYFIQALKAVGFIYKELPDREGENERELWVHKGQGGPWQLHCRVGFKTFSMRAVRKAKGERDMSHKPYSSNIPGRDQQDMKKYVRWVMNKFS